MTDCESVDSLFEVPENKALQGARRLPLLSHRDAAPLMTHNAVDSFESVSKMTDMGKRIAIYLRVSTDKQTTENQRPECEQMARQRGELVSVYEESASAVKHRPAFERMVKDAKRGKFDTLVIWAIDRFGRSMVGNLQDLQELERVGVGVTSVRESWLDTSGPCRPLLAAMFSWVAEQERARLVERTRAGQERARRQGKRIGRPTRNVDVIEARRLLAVKGTSVRAAARAMGLSLGTLQRALAREAPAP
jgi:DNA invertase Pin-like site-specific DNA recombinase